MAKRRNRAVRHNRAKTNEESEEVRNAPHSFVISRGKTGPYVQILMKDFRRIMEPFTASQLKAKKSNIIKDFVSVAGLLHVTHLVIFSRSSLSVYMRMIKLPHGPTLTFRVQSYSLCKDVVSSLKRPQFNPQFFLHAPLLILNGFTEEGDEIKLMMKFFQNMFPSINVTKIRLRNVRRCLLMNFNASDKTIDFRHYAIRTTPEGISRGIRKLVQRVVPNLGNLKNADDLLVRGALPSESEAEPDAPEVEVCQPIKGTKATKRAAVRLTELGPRMTLQSGLIDGEILYHSYIYKTDEEKEEIRKKREKKRYEKELRRKQQEKNVKRKEMEKKLHQIRSLEGMKKSKVIGSDNEQDIVNLETSKKIDVIDDTDGYEYPKKKILNYKRKPLSKRIKPIKK